MNKEMICKNCKYHYIEEISFDYPQSCCSKRQATTEEWCKCNAFEYGDRYIEQLQQQNQKHKEVIDKAVEYINQHWVIDDPVGFKNDLLEILEDKEVE